MNARHLLFVLAASVPFVAGATEPSAGSSTDAAPAANVAPAHHGHHGGGRHLLAKLNLSADQWTQVRSIYAQNRARAQSLAATARANRSALATTPPTEHPAYDSLLAAAKDNAVARQQLRSDVWSQIYAVLTPAQQQAIPGIVAAEQAARESRRAARHASAGSA
ncbi:MAG: Spy/CpxP family protein refolding chaperone [Proteobacteria bacterium]|nr:Spy/CpxP family protein refolding chaperone [Pseudomonadota bacterium]